MEIRHYQAEDAQALTDIFYETIHTVGLEHYTQAQVNAWAPLPVNYDYWRQRLADLPPYVAVLGDQVVGFITLTPAGHIEWTYTHRGYQRRGVASALYRYMEFQALNQGICRLTVCASHFARPFFAKQGFAVLHQNDTERDGQILVNWTMEKYIS
ncbi:MAG: GNAT family N-acetyltransferase [Xanthomonadales bacterium]|nr:GNAT family N-acetyltransferase [Xanthomonadales bacterium]